MLGCAITLFYRLAQQEDDTLKPKLKSAYFCRDPFCPVCLAGVARAKHRKVSRALPQLIKDNPEVRFVNLTLTVRNPKIYELRKTIKRMQKAFVKMMADNRVNHLGYIRSLEVTYGNSAKDDCHPHLHVLIAVPPDYFDTKKNLYLSQRGWSRIWSEKLGTDYSANVSISAVKPRSKNFLKFELSEIVKYCTKATDLLEDKEWTVHYISEILGIKRMSTSGLFRKYMKELEDDPEDLVGKDGKNESSETVLQFRWCWEARDYILQKVIERDTTEEEFSTTKTPQ